MKEEKETVRQSIELQDINQFPVETMLKHVYVISDVRRSKIKKIKNQINQANQSSKHNTGSQFPLDSNRKQSNPFKQKNKSNKTLKTEAEFFLSWKLFSSLYLVMKDIYFSGLIFNIMGLYMAKMLSTLP